MSRLFKREALSFQPSVRRKVVSSFGLDKPRKNADESQPFASKNTMSLKSFKIKTNGDLSRTWLILRLSSIDCFVNHSEKILKTAKKLVGKGLFDAVMRATFYGQFAGGESMETLSQNVNKLSKYGIRSMLCIPIETTATNDEDLALGSERWEKNASIVNGCIEMTDKLEKEGFSQLKLTALCEPELLLRMNEQLIGYERKHEEPQEWNIRLIGELLKAERYKDINIESFSDQSNQQLQAAFERFDKLAMSCKEKNIKFTVDAEQTYIQAALAYFVLTLQYKYNAEIPMVYNTYQCYRKDSLIRLKADYDYATANGFKIAGKIVRGAYMVEERRIAAEQGTQDPINENYDKTTEMYHSVVDFVLPLIKSKQAGFMIASHNESTILYVLRRIAEIDLGKGNKDICFAQLYGMCDHVTEALGNMQLEVYKSVPYGTVDSTLLYLTRRAQENRSVLERSAIERGIISHELMRRGKSWFGKQEMDDAVSTSV